MEGVGLPGFHACILLPYEAHTRISIWEGFQTDGAGREGRRVPAWWRGKLVLFLELGSLEPGALLELLELLELGVLLPLFLK